MRRSVATGLAECRERSSKYTEPFSRYCHAKHWVDDINNRRHDPIGLEEVWGTKWWAMRQFTFLCSVAEVNAVQSRARAKNETTMPQLDFRRKLAQQMIENNIDAPVIPELPPMRIRRASIVAHDLRKQKRGEGMWNYMYRRFNVVTSEIEICAPEVPWMPKTDQDLLRM